MEYAREKITCIEGVHGYEIDTNGVVYGRDGRILKPSTPNNYELVNLSCDGKKFGKTMQVHRIVAMQFIPNPENKPTVNHIDGNKRNNKIENLEWATFKEQNIHARDCLKVKYGESTAKEVVSISRDGKTVRHYKSSSEAAREYNVNKCSVNAWIHGTKNCALGLYWVFKSEFEEKGLDVCLAEKIEEEEESRKYKKRFGCKIAQLTKDGKIVRTFERFCEVENFGFRQSGVEQCCANRDGYHKTYKGFVWKMI